MPYPLEVRPRATTAERARLREQVEEEPRDSGRLDHPGPRRVQAGALAAHLLARPEVSLDAAFLPALGQARRGRSSRSSRSAGLATLVDDEAVRAGGPAR